MEEGKEREEKGKRSGYERKKVNKRLMDRQTNRQTDREKQLKKNQIKTRNLNTATSIVSTLL